MMKQTWSILFVVSCLALPVLAANETESPLALVPQPVKVERGKGVLQLNAGTRIVVEAADAEARNVAEQLAERLKRGAGLDLRIESKGSGPAIVLTRKDANPALGPEGYTLTVKPEGVVISAVKGAGWFYGMQTLLQLLPPQVFGTNKATEAKSLAVPAVRITDQPRFAWRGIMVDSCRHFFPPEDIKRWIGLMAMHKFNTLHWHLTDDQGWRIQIRKYPRLTEVGSQRASSPVPGQPYDSADHQPYGGFYTQEEIRDIVACAKARFITVIPEIEMPGHAAAAIAAYPQLGNQDVPNYQPEVKTTWGVHYYTFAPSEETFAFLGDVMAEVSGLFPEAPFIHVGGDECPKDQWNQSPFVKRLMAEKGLKDGHEVQSYFIGRIEKIVNSHGKRLIGWDEIQEGGLSRTASMMVWRDWKWATLAVNHGNDIVLAPTSHTYLDYGPGPTPGGPGFQVIGGNLPLEKVYDLEPVPASFAPEQVKHVLGVQAQLWSEYILARGKWEYLAFPRACALCEIAWSPRDGKDPADFLKRLAAHEQRLDALKVNYRKADGSPAQPNAKLLP